VHLFGTDNFGRDLFSRTVMARKLAPHRVVRRADERPLGTVGGLSPGSTDASTRADGAMDSLMAFRSLAVAAIMAAIGPRLRTIIALGIVQIRG
jgi:peptide/nickel transport system permease protein